MKEPSMELSPSQSHRVFQVFLRRRSKSIRRNRKMRLPRFCPLLPFIRHCQAKKRSSLEVASWKPRVVVRTALPLCERSEHRVPTGASRHMHASASTPPLGAPPVPKVYPRPMTIPQGSTPVFFFSQSFPPMYRVRWTFADVVHTFGQSTD